MEYILNTKTGVLHEKPCADGDTSNKEVQAGDRQHYSSIEKAKEDDSFTSCHINEYCISEGQC